jgi:DeoR/GlpR family transcriptional regulator of sugar metabolism
MKEINNTAHGPTWVLNCEKDAAQEKQAIAKFAVKEFIRYGSVIQIGSGTTFDVLIDSILNYQIKKPEALDLVIMTTNLSVLQRVRDALVDHIDVLGSTQVILTGGAVHKSLNSLVGPFAAAGVQSQTLIPDFVFWGACGLQFQKEFLITYQFGDELEVQESYACRPTRHRVLLADHNKFRAVSAWRAQISLLSMLQNTNQCTLITTMPEEHPMISRVQKEVRAFEALLDSVVDAEQLDKELAKQLEGKELSLRVVDLAGQELQDWSTCLSIRRKRLRKEKIETDDPDSRVTLALGRGQTT